jgi:hypothetical protein
MSGLFTVATLICAATAGNANRSEVTIVQANLFMRSSLEDVGLTALHKDRWFDHHFYPSARWFI